MTPKQAAFVREYITNPNATEAYKKAGYLVKNDKVASVEGCRTLALPSIQAALLKITGDPSTQLLRRAIITRRQILEGLKGIAEDVKAPHSARVRAYELLGKHKGLFRDRHEVPGHEEAESTDNADKEEVGVDVFISIRSAAARRAEEVTSGGNVAPYGLKELVDQTEANGQAGGCPDPR